MVEGAIDGEREIAVDPAFLEEIRDGIVDVRERAPAGQIQARIRYAPAGNRELSSQLARRAVAPPVGHSPMPWSSAELSRSNVMCIVIPTDFRVCRKRVTYIVLRPASRPLR